MTEYFIKKVKKITKLINKNKLETKIDPEYNLMIIFLKNVKFMDSKGILTKKIIIIKQITKSERFDTKKK